MIQSNPLAGTSTFHCTKSKTPMVVVIDTEFDKLTTGLDRVVEAIVSGNVLTEIMSQVALHQVVAIGKCNELMHEQVTILRNSSTIPVSELDVWDMLVKMNLQDKQLMHVTSFYATTNLKYEDCFGCIFKM